MATVIGGIVASEDGVDYIGVHMIPGISLPRTASAVRQPPTQHCHPTTVAIQNLFKIRGQENTRLQESR